jgi:hypothetical protein
MIATTMETESTKNRRRLGSLDRRGADLLARSFGNIGTLECASGPAAGASPTVLGALLFSGVLTNPSWRFTRPPSQSHIDWPIITPPNPKLIA